MDPHINDGPWCNPVIPHVVFKLDSFLGGGNVRVSGLRAEYLVILACIDQENQDCSEYYREGRGNSDIAYPLGVDEAGAREREREREPPVFKTQKQESETP